MPCSHLGKKNMKVFFEAWEIWKDLLKKCPHHGLDLGVQMQTFHIGLLQSSKQLIDSFARGTTNNLTPQQLQELVGSIDMNNYSWGLVGSKPRGRGAYNVDYVKALEAKVQAFLMKNEGFHSLAPRYEYYGGSHYGHKCQMSNTNYFEEVDYVGNKNIGNPHSNTYNPGWRNHLNFTWKNGNGIPNAINPNLQPYNPPRPQGPSLGFYQPYTTPETVKLEN
ncbi:hypothetical protein L6164_024009 [Bauhinia variegata]|uniref:Uncharacterized protein n=1 Tax=Bauhinia variegata TaxID=167791 RepID=A0ACB9LVY2_BAUVA|nr:hypothetical protein L6164_024009 [Bauhinia variegata]